MRWEFALGYTAAIAAGVLLIMLAIWVRENRPRPMPKAITGAQAKAARELLGWSQNGLAQRAGVELETVAHFEARNRKAFARTGLAIQATCETAGVEFPPKGEPPRLRKG